MSVFDKRAGDWDKKTRRVKLAKDVVEAIIKHAKPQKGMNLADFGAGTGLIMLGLADYAESMTGYDNSEGMLQVLREKAEDAGMKNLTAKYFDIKTSDFPLDAYEMMTCSMVAHHLDDPEVFFAKAYDGLKFGGKLCVADLVKTDVPFHEEAQEGVVYDDGFDLEWVKESLHQCGFITVEIHQAAVIEKERNGETLEFPVFLAVAEK
ncbi:MAG: hypothetical protein C0602_01785 [Denitrovibrio sp.]|nr:MAG: hypothetical protein C0602_01785 [Denitrovibrio sp.]